MAAAALAYCACAAAAGDEFTIVIRDGRFEPAELRVPAGQKLKLVVDNRSASAEEFESYDLDREKIVPGNSRATIFVGPLKPGRYEFIDELNRRTPPGALIAE